MISSSFQCFPDHFPILKEHIAMFTFRFRDRHGTRIQDRDIPYFFRPEYMSMPMHENIARF